MSHPLPPPSWWPLADDLLAQARTLPDNLPPPTALQPDPRQPGAAIHVVTPSPVRRAKAQITMGAARGHIEFDEFSPLGPPFAWTDASGTIVPGEVTPHDLLSVGVVQFPDGARRVPGAWEAPGATPLDDGGTGLTPLRLHALLRLSAACIDQAGLDMLLQPRVASVLVVPEDLIAAVAWAILHVARVSRSLPDVPGLDRPLRLLVLRGGGGDRAALAAALAEGARLIILTTGAMPDWPECLEPPDWLGFGPIDESLIDAQFRATWSETAAGDDPQPVDDAPDDIEAWVFENTLPPAGGLARLTAEDIATAFSAPTARHARYLINQRVLAG